MLPEIWGRSVWESMHYIAAAYPIHPTKSERKAYCMYYKSLINVLPCKSCSVSFKKFMKQLPIHRFLSSRKKLLYWTYLMHNKVNRKLKKSIRISWGDVHKKYITLSYSPKMKIPK